MTLGDFAREILPLADALLAWATSGETVSCREGCAACCRQLVTLSAPEAMQLLECVEAMEGAGRRSAPQEAFATAAVAIEAADLREPLMRLGDPALDEASHFALARRYFALGLECPFLCDRRCSIYSQRFATCREYAVRTPAEQCRDPFHFRVSAVGLPLPFRDILAAMAQTLTGRPLVLIPIPLALEWARAHRADFERPWDAGLLVKNFLPYLEVMLGRMAV